MNTKKPNKTYTTFRQIHGFDGTVQSYQTEEIFSTKTKQNQNVKILKLSGGIGLCLELNGDLMALQCNEDFLHSQMVRLGISNLNAKPRNITILGGADGGVLKHCLKRKPYSVKVLELDKEMIQICQKHLPHISEGAFDDKRVKIIHGDAFDTIKKIRKSSQHLIFIDMADSAVDESCQVFGPRSNDLLSNIKICLKDGGVVLAQASAYQQQILSIFKKYFEKSYGWTDNFDLRHANSFVYAIKH
jgi:spermidine synthase